MTFLQKLPALTTLQMIEVDRLMMEEWHISLTQMMENAGRNLAELARWRLGGSLNSRRVLVLSGTGNNGGGGMVAARHLHNWGAQVDVALIGTADRLKEIPAHQWHILQKMRLAESNANFERTDMIIDAMIGYGMTGSPRPSVADWIARANASGKPILSLDAPSGLDTTTGIPSYACIRADATLMLALPKTGLLTPEAKPFVGELFLADISVPPDLYASPSLGLKVVSPFDEGSIVKLN
jgi:NAD(P)H-hydrate epimerase